MTTSADRWLWTPDAWAERLASGNPVFPFEWAVHYRGGARFARVCQGQTRTTADAPLTDVDRLRITRPGFAMEILAADPDPLGLVIRARVVGVLGSPARGGVSGYTFGFVHAIGFVGVRLDGVGRVVTSNAIANGGGPP